MKSKLKKIIKSILPENTYNNLVLPKHYSKALFANIRYGFPARGMKVIGITGTNGKTTTSVMLNSILRQAGIKTGMLTSALLQVGNREFENPQELTTADAMQLQKWIKQIKKTGATHLVLETASHGLAQKRVWAIPYEGAIFTNLTKDHLDYHKTFENYGKTKQKLFKLSKKWNVLNIDDSSFELMNVKNEAQTYSYGFSDTADIYPLDFALHKDSLDMKLHTPKGDIETTLQITGKFNVANAMAATGAALKLGIARDDIAKGLKKMKPIPGRMDKVDAGQEFGVFIDNAHTGDSLTNLIQSLQETTKGRIIAMIGADGERGPDRRIPLGEAVGKIKGKLEVVVTDQEPFGDDPIELRSDVIKGLKNSNFKNYSEIPNREEAIRHCIKSASMEDIVLIAGIGSQKYRGMKEGKIEWDERSVVEEKIKEVI